MEQFVTVFVLCGRAGRELFEQVQSKLTCDGLQWDRDAMISVGQVAYWNHHLDLWSMGDSFDRFIKSHDTLSVSSGAHQLICCGRESCEIEGEARTEEEARLKEILTQAIQAYGGAMNELYLFQIRSVFTASKGFNPVAE